MPSFGGSWVITISVTYWVQDAVFRLTKEGKLWGGAQKGSVGKHQFYNLEKVNSITRPASKNVTEAMTRIKNGKKKKLLNRIGLWKNYLWYCLFSETRVNWKYWRNFPRFILFSNPWYKNTFMPIPARQFLSIQLLCRIGINTYLSSSQCWPTKLGLFMGNQSWYWVCLNVLWHYFWLSSEFWLNLLLRNNPTCRF